MATALIGMGSNLGDRGATLARATEMLRSAVGIKSVTTSSWHETLPIGGPTGQGAFLNGAARLEVTVAPQHLLNTLQQIENQLGRKREVRWDQRTLDLDLLLYDDLILETPDLIIPHPMMAFRRFVLEPAAEVASDMVHAVLHRSVESLLTHLNDAVPYAAIVGGALRWRTWLARDLANHFGTQELDDPCGKSVASAESNQASLTIDQRLEFLDSRCRSIQSATWPDRDRWTISNFWLGDVCLSLADEHDEPGQTLIADAWWRAQQTTMPAKLVIILDYELRLDQPSVAAHWRRLSSGPMIPFLLFRSHNFDVLLAESTAAIQAMQ